MFHLTLNIQPEDHYPSRRPMHVEDIDPKYFRADAFCVGIFPCAADAVVRWLTALEESTKS